MKAYDFQQEVVDKYWPQPGILNGDDMGLGKTVEGILLDRRKRIEFKRPHARTLIIAPLSVLDVWSSHLQDWAPELRVRVIDPKAREALFLKEAHVYVVHWDALRRMPELCERSWFHVIADEAHRAKNRKAQQTQALKKIRAEHKTALTGTPADDKPHDLWSILNWLYPKDFTSYWKFYNDHVDFKVHPKGGYKVITGVRNVDALHRKIRKFYFRRLKSEVTELPEKYYTEMPVNLLPAQRRAYDQMRKDMLAWVGEHEDEPLAAPTVISKLMRLQQFAISSCMTEVIWKQREQNFIEQRNLALGKWQPQHHPDGRAPWQNHTWIQARVVRMVEPSAKLDKLMELIEDHPNESFVVFSQFKQAINLLAQRCTQSEISCGVYTGDTNKEDRDNIVRQFQAGRLRVFAGTIRAGGEGITLHKSSTVVFVDRDWSPSKNRQAEDRLHRVGQKNAVQVIDLVARDTVDRGRLQTIEQKWKFIRQLLGDIPVEAGSFYFRTINSER